MSTHSYIPQLTTGVTVSNLILVENSNEEHPEYVYNVDSRAIDGINLKDVTSSVSSNKDLSYIQVKPFVFDPAGKKLIIYAITSDPGAFRSTEGKRDDVVIFQESASGQLFRLTPISEKCLLGVKQHPAKVLNHPQHQLKEYSKEDLLHYFDAGVKEYGGDDKQDFNYRSFESSVSYKDGNLSDKDESFREYSDYQARLGGSEMWFSVDHFTEPMTQKDPLANFQPTYADIPAFPDYEYIVEWNVVINKDGGEVLGTMDGVDQAGGMINARQEIFEYQKTWLANTGMTIPPAVVILPNPTSRPNF